MFFIHIRCISTLYQCFAADQVSTEAPSFGAGVNIKPTCYSNGRWKQGPHATVTQGGLLLCTRLSS